MTHSLWQRLMKREKLMWQQRFLLRSWNYMIGKEDLFVTDQIATRYIYFNLNVKPFDDVRVREAFNLAVTEKSCARLSEKTQSRRIIWWQNI